MLKLEPKIENDGPWAPVIFSDFDGTITQTDVTDAILSQFADPVWRQVEEEWVTGRIGSRECLERQMALVRAEARELNALIDAVPIDPHFAEFSDFTRKAEIPFYVVSDGFDYVIRRALRNCGLNGELVNGGSRLFSSSMRLSGGRLRVGFPHGSSSCSHGCATCKPEVMRRAGRGHHPVVFIGDGLSDRFAVEEAGLVFAKDKLLEYCCDHGISCTPFSSFAEVQAELAEQAGRTWPARGRLARQGQ